MAHFPEGTTDRSLLLAHLIVASGLTQIQAAEYLDVDSVRIRKYCSPRSPYRPTDAMLGRIANLVGAVVLGELDSNAPADTVVRQKALALAVRHYTDGFGYAPRQVVEPEEEDIYDI